MGVPLSEYPVTRISWKSFGRLCFNSMIAGAIVGAILGLVGYNYREADYPLIALESAVFGAGIATPLAAFLYLVAFRSCDIVPVFKATAWVSGVIGILVAAIARHWTYDYGVTASVVVSPVVAVICAAAIRIYIAFARPIVPSSIEKS
jgi:hypothetical protein